MDIVVLDTNLDPISIADIYESFIWTDRYYECGDFELYTSIEGAIPDHIKQDYYLQNPNSEHVMVIEKLAIKTDSENGNHLTVTGRSLESILDRRVIWKQTTLTGNFQNGIKRILTENIISPSDNSRKINNFVFEASDDPVITKLTIDAQYTGNNVYDVICSLCREKKVGFKITINDSKQFVFKLYAGVDRSYQQTTNPYVIFSPSFDNIVNSNYVESKSALKNVVLVAGEGEGSERKYASVGSSSGLNRRELFVDARDISSDVGDGVTLSETEYTTKLKQRGSEKLSECKEVSSFEGEAETNLMFKYKEDFFEGDVVQVANEYGHETPARILEMVTSVSEQGISIYPTFESIEEGA